MKTANVAAMEAQLACTRAELVLALAWSDQSVLRLGSVHQPPPHVTGARTECPEAALGTLWEWFALLFLLFFLSITQLLRSKRESNTTANHVPAFFSFNSTCVPRVNTRVVISFDWRAFWGVITHFVLVACSHYRVKHSKFICQQCFYKYIIPDATLMARILRQVIFRKHDDMWRVA